MDYGYTIQSSMWKRKRRARNRNLMLRIPWPMITSSPLAKTQLKISTMISCSSNVRIESKSIMPWHVITIDQTPFLVFRHIHLYLNGWIDRFLAPSVATEICRRKTSDCSKRVWEESHKWGQLNKNNEVISVKCICSFLTIYHKSGRMGILYVILCDWKFALFLPAKSYLIKEQCFIGYNNKCGRDTSH